MADNNARALQGRVQRRVDLSKDMLKAMGIDPAVFVRITLNALVRNPKIGECDPTSLDIAIMESAQSGLVPDGKEAAIIPFREKGKAAPNATLVPMIEGRIKLARQAVPGLTLWARVVYEGDKFIYEEGLTPKLIHRRNPLADTRDEKIVAAYAVAVFPNQALPEYEVFLQGDILRARSYSRATHGPWDTHYPEMVKKSVLRMLLKRLPKSINAPSEPPSALENLDIGAVDETGRLDVNGLDYDPSTGEIVDPPQDEEPEEKPKPRRRTTTRRRRANTQQQKPAPPPPEDPEDDEDGDDDDPF